jgi:hypothetical protein
MATYVCATYYTVISLGNGQFQIKSGALGGTQTCTDNQSDDTFTSGETIYVSDGTNDYTEIYVGYFAGGFVAEDGGTYYFYTNDTTIAFDTIFTVDTGAFTVCFLAGTRIATPDGEAAVEALGPGDLVLTADGRAAPVRWVGVQTVVPVFADPLRSFPIRIAAGALGQNLPVRDLLVSPDHALFLDGVLVQAGALVNGTTIVRQTAMPERFTYFHVELDDHSLILAEGVPAETFLDTVTRRRFDNWAAYEARYGDTGPVLTELAAPRIKSARQLPAALRERLAARAIARAAGTAVAA